MTMASHVERVKGYVNAAHQQGKPLFIAEMGTLGGFNAPLSDAEEIIRDLTIGVDGFNRWSFINRGDLDGQWQLLQTWDASHKKLLDVYTPYPNAYYVLGLLSRFTAKHSTVLSCDVTGGKIDAYPRVFAAPLRSPKGNLTLAVVDDSDQAWDATIDLHGMTASTLLYCYDVSKADKDRTDLAINPKAEFVVTGEAPISRQACTRVVEDLHDLPARTFRPGNHRGRLNGVAFVSPSGTAVPCPCSKRDRTHSCYFQGISE